MNASFGGLRAPDKHQPRRGYGSLNLLILATSRTGWYLSTFRWSGRRPDPRYPGFLQGPHTLKRQHLMRATMEL
ncbi:hypothetical protein CEXT_230341 [Caerostris extrusa]|uniref:Uncharacterized protein n=1 Tax=Caerostris extrusa TaxID=172846 RepID=A0AAV4UA09_CAEEX|nr:hypothetical protein CEXT_230341 [Caerostris extrusa]